MKFKILLAAFVIPVCTHFTFSQDDDIRDKIIDIKLDKLTKKLELDESVKPAFIEKYKTFAKGMRELNQRRAKTYKLMVENMETGDGLDTLVSQVIENEIEFNDRKEEFAKEMKSMLTPKQAARMIVFERKFNNEIKRLMKQFQKDNKRDRPFRDD